MGWARRPRLADNPTDKLLPALDTLVDAVNRMAFIPDQRSGDLLLWSDTAASLTRLFTALAISTAIALVIGMVVGMLPYARSLLAPVIATISMCRRWRCCRSCLSSSAWAKPPRSP